MENVEVKDEREYTKKEKEMQAKQKETMAAGDVYAENLNKKKSKEQKKILKAFMMKRNAARAKQKLKPAYTAEQIEEACK